MEVNMSIYAYENRCGRWRGEDVRGSARELRSMSDAGVHGEHSCNEKPWRWHDR